MKFFNHQLNNSSFENTKIFGPKQELDYNERYTPIFKNICGYLFMKYSFIQFLAVLCGQYAVFWYTDSFDCIFYLYFIFLIIQFVKFVTWRILNLVGLTKLSSNEDFKDIVVELKEVFTKIVPLVRLWLIMSTGLCSVYIFYYEEGSYLGVSYIVPLGICVTLMVIFSIRSVIEYDISSNKNLNDHSMVTVNHVLNMYVQKHLKSDAWVVGTYQSFVSFIFFVFVLSSFCNLGPKYLDITLPQFLLSNDKYFWILFKSQDLRYIFFSNMFVLYNLKIVVQASMNPFFSRYLARGIKHATIGKVLVAGGVTAATVGGASYDNVMRESTSLDGNPGNLTRWPNGIVQWAQHSSNLPPYITPVGKELAHAFRDVDRGLRDHIVYGPDGFMEAESTKEALKKNGLLLRDGRIIKAPKSLVVKIFK